PCLRTSVSSLSTGPRPPPATLFPYTTLFRSLEVASESEQQLTSHRVIAVIPLQIEVLDDAERLFHTTRLGEGDSPVESHYRARVDSQQLIVEGKDLGPIGRSEVRCRAVDRRNRRLNLIGPGRPSP